MNSFNPILLPGRSHMKIGVCIRQVPNRDYPLSLDSEGKWIREDDLAWEMNEFDLYGIEAGLQLKEKLGGEVFVVTVGPSRSDDVLRKALAMGADRAYRIEVADFPRTSPYAVARALTEVIRQENADLVITGVQSEDMAFFQTGALLAGFLGYESASMVVGIEAEDSENLKVTLELEGGAHEILKISLPAVLMVQTGWNQPRYATLKGIMMAKRKPLKVLTLADLELSADAIRGAKGTVEWIKLEEPVQETHVEFLSGAPEEIAEQLILKLKKEAKVL